VVWTFHRSLSSGALGLFCCYSAQIIQSHIAVVYAFGKPNNDSTGAEVNLGHQTHLGRSLYQIGLVDADCVDPKWARNPAITRL